ncbi:efflux RND transporter periplasmic adaptor subunit [Rhodoferax sp. UBA5149]|uniref:efflux RND transporter periplasmic adaptor subunit n=1 Tax=Rhodoferax sp. UBA5149 TaxID=1947379 RepID=UPI0025D7F88F|nr:HlyD family efflux transporter periplasmic adaptor subunit [Rhodoferax sp. UBA5149]
MKRKLWIGIVSLLMLALLGWAFMPTPTEVEIAAVTQGRFERAVQEDGKTRLRDRYVVSTPLTGRVARINLKQGDTVERNATVATLWPVSPALLDARARAEQGARIGAMQASVARAQANVGRAGAALEQARAELKRSETLAQQGFVSPTQNETGRLNVRLREKELESARQEEAAARHELDQSRIVLQQFSQSPQDAQQRAYEIKAPVSGKVLKVPQQSEGVVAAGTPLMELGDPTQLEVVVDILTEDAAQIKPGTMVQLANWGGPDVLAGRVRLIEPAAFTKVSALGVEEQRVNAIIDITSAPEKWQTLSDGFKVDVRVLVQVVENAVKVPVSALFPLGARSALFVLDKGHARLREIEVAARNGVDAWVKSGLTKGTQVIVYPDTKLKDGDRVKAR